MQFARTSFLLVSGQCELTESSEGDGTGQGTQAQAQALWGC